MTDFGPYGMGMTQLFCETIKAVLLDERFKDQKVVYYTSVRRGPTAPNPRPPALAPPHPYNGKI